MILAPTLSLNTPARGFDADATAFAAASGATDVAALSAFVKGVKELGLWNSMVCWPLRSSQNAGTGTTAYSMGGLGTFNGTLVNGPAWGSDALDFAANTSAISTTVQVAASPIAAMFVHKSAQAQADNESVFFTAGVNINGRQFISSNSALETAQNYSGLSGAWYSSSFDATSFGSGSRTGRDYVSFRVLSASAARISRNAAQSSSDLSVSAWDSSSPDFVRFGFYPASGSDSGLSFMAYMTAAVSNSLDAQFYTLYKQTLGTGLGLP
jgi:hypothetical protein